MLEDILFYKPSEDNNIIEIFYLGPRSHPKKGSCDQMGFQILKKWLLRSEYCTCISPQMCKGVSS